MSSQGIDAPTSKEDIVIIGGGIAGLATALALHRLGMRSLVLEQSDSLRTGGTALTLFKNGWRVLDVLGIGDELRGQFLQIEGLVMKTAEGKELRSFMYKDIDPSQEVRAVQRKILLQTLADKLPPDTLQFSSRLENIEKDEETGEIKLKLANGTHLSPKVVVGCDGIRSPTAKWMGFRDTKYSGHCALRGMTIYPDGQPHQPLLTWFYGRGARAGFVPVSSTKVYWFILYSSNSPGTKFTDPSELKKQALDLVKDWPSEYLNIINLASEDSISRSPLEDRWLWPFLTPKFSKGGVVLAGDAWHPMTPNLGQGGCCALEDAVVLAKKLSKATNSGQESIEEALRSYGEERWPRVFPMTVKANLIGAFLQSKNSLICALRDGFILPKVVQMRPMLEHTNFACEPL